MKNRESMMAALADMKNAIRSARVERMKSKMSKKSAPEGTNIVDEKISEEELPESGEETSLDEACEGDPMEDEHGEEELPAMVISVSSRRPAPRPEPAKRGRPPKAR